MLSLVPSVDYNSGAISVSLNQTNDAYAFQGSYGVREDWSFTIEYYVTMNSGSDLCSYLWEETTTGSGCAHGWNLCGVSPDPSTSTQYTGVSLCIPY